MNDWESDFLDECTKMTEVVSIKQLKVLMKINNKAEHDVFKIVSLSGRLKKLKNRIEENIRSINNNNSLNDWEKKFITNQILQTKFSQKQRKCINKILEKIQDEVKLHLFIEYITQ